MTARTKPAHSTGRPGTDGRGHAVLEADERGTTAAMLRRGGVPLFAATLFLSALLLFALQPMFTRMVLPIWGGSPAVWSTALLFFQAVLLAGYLYVHLLHRLPLTAQGCIHLLLLAGALLVLPVGVATQPYASLPPALALLLVLATSIGAPFFAVSTTAPLLMHWFSRTGHEHAADPYFLYGASNLGSLLALLSYPVLVEPAFGLARQGLVWSLLYLLLAAGIVCCLLLALLALGRAPAPAKETAAPAAAPPGPRRIARWLALAFVPSGLLLAVTRHLSTDVAAAPFLWVAPLVLFLLSFVLVFARRPPLPHRAMATAQAVALAALLLAASGHLLRDAGLHLLAFFTVAMVCHGELARSRPDARHLTGFFVWIAVGGALGGLFTALIAPLLFTGIWEYPLLLVLACLLRPVRDDGPGRRPGQGWRDVVLPLCLAAIYLSALFLWGGSLPAFLVSAGRLPWDLLAAALLFGFRHRRLRFALGFALLAFAPPLIEDARDLVERQRSFFGVHTVERDANDAVRLLYHGTTIHGAQYRDPVRWREPQTYYTQDGPLGQAVTALRKAARIRTVGAVGLGAGTLVCLLEPSVTVSFYEIDPVVVALATDRRHFRYLSDCGPQVAFRLGDGRLTLAAETGPAFDLLVIDAFSSDAIPVHLITREAVALYRRRLAAGGVMLFHISNKHVGLEPVLAALAADAGLAGLAQSHRPPADPDRPYAFASHWVALAEREEDLAALAAGGTWRALQGRDGVGVWSDDYADIVGVLEWGRRKTATD